MGSKRRHRSPLMDDDIASIKLCFVEFDSAALVIAASFL